MLAEGARWGRAAWDDDGRTGVVVISLTLGERAGVPSWLIETSSSVAAASSKGLSGGGGASRAIPAGSVGLDGLAKGLGGGGGGSSEGDEGTAGESEATGSTGSSGVTGVASSGCGSSGRCFSSVLGVAGASVTGTGAACSAVSMGDSTTTESLATTAETGAAVWSGSSEAMATIRGTWTSAA